MDLEDRKRFKVGKKEQGETLVDFLARRTSVSKKAAKRWLDAEAVRVNNKCVWMAKHALEAEDVVEVVSTSGDAADVKNSALLYEDSVYILVNKPAGMLSVGRKSAEQKVRREWGNQAIAAVHRLDRDTSGCLMFAKNRAAWTAATELFRSREIFKSYHALVHGRPRKESGTIRQPIEGQKAVTHYRVVSANRQISHLVLRLDTGRTHQARKHLAGIGHPVVGERRYGKRSYTVNTAGVRRQMLHAEKIRFEHPWGGQLITVAAPLAQDFAACLQSWGIS